MTSSALSSLLREGVSDSKTPFLDDRVILDDMSRWKTYHYLEEQDLGIFTETVGNSLISVFRLGVVLPGSGSLPDALGDFRAFSVLKLRFSRGSDVWYNKPLTLSGNPDEVYCKTDVQYVRPGEELNIFVEGLTEDRSMAGGDIFDYRVILPIDLCAIRRKESDDEDGEAMGKMSIEFSVTVLPATESGNLLPILEFTSLPATQFLSSSPMKRYRLHELLKGYNLGYAVTPSYISIANEGTHNYVHWHFVHVNGRSAIGMQICDANGGEGIPVSLKALQDEDVRIIGPGVSRAMSTDSNAIGKVFNEYKFHRGSGNWLLTDGDEIWFASGEEAISRTPQFDKTVPLMYFNIAQRLRSNPREKVRKLYHGKPIDF